MDEAMNTEHIVESNVVGIYPDYTFQMMEGYGCSLTESACYLLSKMDSATRKEALAQWFGPAGMDAWFVRVHIDSCDYSLSEYQAVEDPLADPELETFSIDRDRQYILPVLKEAMAMAGHPIHVLLSPWSPPAQWKTPPEMTRNDASVYGGEEGDVIDLSKPGRCSAEAQAGILFVVGAVPRQIHQRLYGRRCSGDDAVDSERGGCGHELG